MVVRRVDKELEEAKSQLTLASQLSKELANAQREIRDLRRTNSIQHMLKTSPMVGRTSPPRSGRSEPTSQNGVSPRPSAEIPGTGMDVLPDKLLMRTFSYLDANSVFAVSLTNRAFMMRVNNLFGMPTVVLPDTSSNRRGQKPPTPGRSPNPRSIGRSKSEMLSSPAEKDKVHPQQWGVRGYRGGAVVADYGSSSWSADEQGRNDRQVSQEGGNEAVSRHVD